VEIGAKYLEIALKLARLVPDWVEAYVGPPALAEAVDGLEEVSADQLYDDAQQLADRVGDEVQQPDRRAWLVAQLQAIGTALQARGGEHFSYQELFQRCHGGHVELVPDGQFERAHALLDRALPGNGDHVAARYRAWRDTQLVAPEQLQQALESLGDEMQRRSRDKFGLPDGDAVKWELVSEVPWAGNAEYAGRRQTLISINTDRPISAPRLLELVCHEAYPGHHAEHVCKDASLIQQDGRDELSVYVYPTPQALVAEGLACLALDALLGQDADRIAAECLGPLGVRYDDQVAAVVREAEDLLMSVRSNLALMIDDGRPPDEVREYALTWLLDEPRHIDDSIKNLDADSWRPYASCYPVGLDLCRQYAADSPERFRDLLYLQLTPADLTRHAG
jgi:hypothetical protein